MNMRKLLLAAVAALGLGVVATSASAAPLGALGTAKPEAGETSAVDNVTYRYVRQCGWRWGHYRCWHARVWTPGPVYGFYHGPRRWHHHRYGFYGRRWY
jgi:hypothetical protein